MCVFVHVYSIFFHCNAHHPVQFSCPNKFPLNYFTSDVYEITTRLLSMRWYVEFAELLQLLSLESWPSYREMWGILKGCASASERDSESKRMEKNHVVNWNENESFVRLMLPWNEIKEERLRFFKCTVVSEKKHFISQCTYLTFNEFCVHVLLNLSRLLLFSLYTFAILYTHTHTSAHGKIFVIFVVSKFFTQDKNKIQDLLSCSTKLTLEFRFHTIEFREFCNSYWIHIIIFLYTS